MIILDLRNYTSYFLALWQSVQSREETQASYDDTYVIYG